jgi:hypothetical protein
MVTGIAAAMVVPFALPSVSALNSFPIILGLSLVGAIVGTLTTAPDDPQVLKNFYKRVRPWGFWGPIRELVQQEDPAFKPNPDFLRDMFNIVVGIAWQTTLVAFPIYIVIRRYNYAAIAFGIVLLTSAILKFTWYDHLRQLEIDVPLEVLPPEPQVAR